MAKAISTTAKKKLFLTRMACSTSFDGGKVHPPFDFIASLIPVMLSVRFRISAFTLVVVMDLEKVTKRFV